MKVKVADAWYTSAPVLLKVKGAPNPVPKIAPTGAEEVSPSVRVCETCAPNATYPKQDYLSLDRPTVTQLLVG